MDILRYNPENESLTHNCNVEITIEHGKYGPYETYYCEVKSPIQLIKYLPDINTVMFDGETAFIAFETMDEMFELLEAYSG